MKLIFVIGAVGVAASALWLATRSLSLDSGFVSPGEAQGEKVASPAAPAQVARELASMRTELAQLKARMPRIDSAPRTEREGEPVGEVESPATHIAPPSRRTSSAEVVAMLDDRHHSEVRDRAWETQMEGAMANALGSEFVNGSSIQSVDCRATMCKLEIAHDDPAAAGRFVDALPNISAFESEIFFQRIGTEADPRTVVFSARAGSSLPRLEPMPGD